MELDAVAIYNLVFDTFGPQSAASSVLMPAFIVLIVFVLIVLLQGLKICQESERLAVLRLGKMTPLRGPGLVITAPAVDRCMKIKIGDRAVMIDAQHAKISDFLIPVYSHEKLPAGGPVRILSFEIVASEEKARVALDTNAHLPEIT